MRGSHRVHVVLFAAGGLVAVESPAIPRGTALLLKISNASTRGDRLRTGERRFGGRSRQGVQTGIVSERCIRERGPATRVRSGRTSRTGELRAGLQCAGLIVTSGRNRTTR